MRICAVAVAAATTAPWASVSFACEEGDLLAFARDPSSTDEPAGTCRLEELNMELQGRGELLRFQRGDEGRADRGVEHGRQEPALDDHLDDPGLAYLEPRYLRMLREMGTMMSLNRVELTGSITTVGPAWFFPITAQVVYGLSEAEGAALDELYHGGFFNEYRRIESVKAHAALGGRLVHGCQKVIRRHLAEAVTCLGTTSARSTQV